MALCGPDSIAAPPAMKALGCVCPCARRVGWVSGGEATLQKTGTAGSQSGAAFVRILLAGNGLSRLGN